jgi:hypothetical protein
MGLRGIVRRGPQRHDPFTRRVIRGARARA